MESFGKSKKNFNAANMFGVAPVGDINDTKEDTNKDDIQTSGENNDKNRYSEFNDLDEDDDRDEDDDERDEEPLE